MPRTSAKRKACLLALLLCGSGSFCYGWLFHTAPVYREQEREVAVAVPTLFGLGEEVEPEVNPFEDSPPQRSSVAYKLVPEKYWEARPEPEWAITREVTVGGVTRLANGQLRRTYSGKPPALCPT